MTIMLGTSGRENTLRCLRAQSWEGKNMKLYSEKLEAFEKAHPCQTMTVEGAMFRYMLCGKEGGRTLVLLNGGMNTLEMWMDYVDPLSRDYQVLLFDFPQELTTNHALVVGMHAFFQMLRIEQPVFIGASDGGMVAQIYVQQYPGETGALVLISTGGMDANTLKSLKRKYFFAPLMLWYMKHCNYEKLKPTLIKAGMSHIRDESPEEIAYAQDMFETIFKDYKQEKDVHISSLLADLMNQHPVTALNFSPLKGRILLILPNQDFFSGQMQRSLIALMHNSEIAYVSGGHLSTVLKADDYIRTIRAFLEAHPAPTLDFPEDDIEIIDEDDNENV